MNDLLLELVTTCYIVLCLKVRTTLKAIPLLLAKQWPLKRASSKCNAGAGLSSTSFTSLYLKKLSKWTIEADLSLTICMIIIWWDICAFVKVANKCSTKTIKDGGKRLEIDSDTWFMLIFNDEYWYHHQKIVILCKDISAFLVQLIINKCSTKTITKWKRLPIDSDIWFC